MVQTFSKNEYFILLEALQIARDSLLQKEQNEDWEELENDEKCEIQDKRNLIMDLLEKVDNFDASDDFNLIVVQELKRLAEKQKVFLRQTYNKEMCF